MSPPLPLQEEIKWSTPLLKKNFMNKERGISIYLSEDKAFCPSRTPFLPHQLKITARPVKIFHNVIRPVIVLHYMTSSKF